MGIHSDVLMNGHEISIEVMQRTKTRLIMKQLNSITSAEKIIIEIADRLNRTIVETSSRSLNI